MVEKDTQQFSKASARGRGQPFPSSSPSPFLQTHLKLVREGGVHSCLRPFSSKRLSDVGRVCDLSEEGPATHLPCPSANRQPLQVQKEVAVRQSLRGLRLEKHIGKARQRRQKQGALGVPDRDAGKQERGSR